MCSRGKRKHRDDRGEHERQARAHGGALSRSIGIGTGIGIGRAHGLASVHWSPSAALLRFLHPAAHTDRTRPITRRPYSFAAMKPTTFDSACICRMILLSSSLDSLVSES